MPTAVTTLTGNDGNSANAPKEFLTFTLDKEEYGIDIQAVQELRGYETVTKIANCKDYMKGVINLRGAIVPIIDMRIRMQLPDPTYDQFTVVVVISFESLVVGLVVDSVSDVISLGHEQIKSAPELNSATDTNYIVGLGMLEQRMLILVDTAALLASVDLNFNARLAA